LSPIIIDLCHQADFNPKIRQYVDTSEGIFGLVAAGLGVTIYTESAFNVRSRGIIIRPLLDETAEIKTVAAWLKKNESPSLSKFIKIIEKFSVT
jgi:DNA-binding transcriptional LysR family regulator